MIPCPQGIAVAYENPLYEHPFAVCIRHEILFRQGQVSYEFLNSRLVPSLTVIIFYHRFPDKNRKLYFRFISAISAPQSFISNTKQTLYGFRYVRSVQFRYLKSHFRPKKPEVIFPVFRKDFEFFSSSIKKRRSDFSNRLKKFSITLFFLH